jgi:hypothetical protein
MKQTLKRIETTPPRNSHQNYYKSSPNFQKAEPDLYLIFRDKIYPVHKKYVKESKII